MHRTCLNVAAVFVATWCQAVGTIFADCTLTTTGKTPLNDLGPGLYLGQTGGLYSGGTNVRPVGHHAAGLALASQIQPLNAAGSPDPVNGKIVLISIGMSNTTQEFAILGPGAFKPRADNDPAKNPKLVIVDCAFGGHAATEWIDPGNEVWPRCHQRLSNAGLTAAQVQVSWVKLAERTSDVPDGAFPAHAEFHASRLDDILRLARANFPNLAMAFMSSRTRSYETNPFALNPEPFAYEENFSVKWVIESQINGTGNLNFDPLAGPVVAPYIVWGPYLWVDGLSPRSDGLQWFCSDLVGDFTHPSQSGATKVADQLLAFFKTDPLTRPWYLRTGVVGQAPTVSIDADATAGMPGLVVQFAANATDADGTILQYAWTFGDGGSSLSANPTKSFPVAGEYPVILTVTDDDGNTTTASQSILVGPPQTPALSSRSLLGLAVLMLLTGGAIAGGRRTALRRV